MTISKSVLRRMAVQMPLLTERGFTIKVHKAVNSLYQSSEIAYISWKQLGELMGRKELERWNKWISGQTVIAQGCYPHDLERFLADLPVID